MVLSGHLFLVKFTVVYWAADVNEGCLRCCLSGTDDPDLWNQTLEAEEIQSAVEKAEKKETGIVHQAQSGATAQGGKKRRIDAAMRVWH